MVSSSSAYADAIIARVLQLNAILDAYSEICEKFKCVFNGNEISVLSGLDSRIKAHTNRWEDCILLNDFARRQALVEIDVLVSMAFGLSLAELKTMYNLQFHILQSQEADTWYDTKGRIVFTNNRSLTGVGFSRPEFENPNVVTPIRRSDAPWDGIMKHAPAGYVFARTITDDTMPGGPVERTIEYHAPFDRCDREQDYETAWKFFEEKYGGQA